MLLTGRWSVLPAALLLVLVALSLVSCQDARPGEPTATPGAQAQIVPLPKQPTAQPEPAASTSAPAPTATEASDYVAAAGEDNAAGAPLAATPPAATPTPAPTPTAATARSSGRVIAIDPGHGGPEVGAAAFGLLEKDVNLRIALKLAERLRAAGYQAVLTRDEDRAVSPLYKGGGYAGGLTYDVQARVDIANAAGADLFFSIHNNGSADPEQSGTEVWYNRERSFADRNLALANLLQDALLKRIRALGYQVVDRGIKDDSNFRVFRGRSYNIYVLGPGTGARPHEPTHMPGVLGESLFISNAADAAMLRQERTLDAIAAAYHDAVRAYFARFTD